jgi:aryl-alcohol dehydrogenase-like predicted oxidoreductase
MPTSIPSSAPTEHFSRLGFGTSGIMGAALTTSRRLRLLETAYAHGIRHFDTAPLYGQGEAESLLGQFSRGKRDSITITTKFGLTPRRIPA